MADNILLYWGSGSGPCWRVMIALEEKGLSGYKHKLLSFAKGEHKSDEVLALNPRGTLPTMKDGDIVLSESVAILLHLELAYPGQGSELLPTTSAERALVLQRLIEFSGNLEVKLMKVMRYYFSTKEEERDQEHLKTIKAALREEWERWDGYLAKSSSGFVAGASFSLADAALYSILGHNIRLGFPVGNGKTPKLAEYFDRLKERKSIVASWPPHWKESPPTLNWLADV